MVREASHLGGVPVDVVVDPRNDILMQESVCQTLGFTATTLKIFS